MAGTPGKREGFERLKAEIASRQETLTMLLGGAVGVDRFQQAVMMAIQRNPDLLNYPADSLVSSALRAAQDRLLPDGVEGAFVIRKDRNRNYEKVVTWQPMVQGLLKVAKLYGGVRNIVCELVYDGEHFRYVAGTELRIEHEPDPDKADISKLRAAYAVFHMTDGSMYVEVMTRRQLEDVRLSSDSGKDGKGPWGGKFAGEMYRKTVLRRGMKRVPLLSDESVILQRAVQRVDEDYSFPGRPHIDTLAEAGVALPAAAPARPPPALPREAAKAMGLEADKVEMVKDQLGAIHTKDELDAYLGESRLRAWMDRLERNRHNHPEVYEGVALAVAACRARVDPASREDGADLPGGEDAPDAENDDPPETLPFFAPDPEHPETWKLYAVEAEGGMSVAQAWCDLWWKPCLRAMPDHAAKLLQENEAHLDAIAARGGEYEAAVIVVRRAAEQARMAPVADRTPVADGSEVAAS